MGPKTKLYIQTSQCNMQQLGQFDTMQLGATLKPREGRPSESSGVDSRAPSLKRLRES